MNILETIIAHKQKEVVEKKEIVPVKLLEHSIYYKTPCVSFKKYLQRNDKEGIIAEIKRKSPSEGFINKHISVEQLSIGYMQAGASALSVLTDKEFFGGSNEDLSTARKFNYCPILRKDFTIDEYQIIEAKSIGADVILLIAAALTAVQVKLFSKLAKDLGMEVLLEIHNQEEFDKTYCDTVDVIGINNRNLKDFKIDIDLSIQLAKSLPKDLLKISESGIQSAETILKLKKNGFSGFLIGEYFMHTASPELTCKELIVQLKELKKEKLQTT